MKIDFMWVWFIGRENLHDAGCGRSIHHADSKRKKKKRVIGKKSDGPDMREPFYFSTSHFLFGGEATLNFHFFCNANRPPSLIIDWASESDNLKPGEKNFSSPDFRHMVPKWKRFGCLFLNIFSRRLYHPAADVQSDPRNAFRRIWISCDYGSAWKKVKRFFQLEKGVWKMAMWHNSPFFPFGAWGEPGWKRGMWKFRATTRNRWINNVIWIDVIELVTLPSIFIILMRFKRC